MTEAAQLHQEALVSLGKSQFIARMAREGAHEVAKDLRRYHGAARVFLNRIERKEDAINRWASQARSAPLGDLASVASMAKKAAVAAVQAVELYEKIHELHADKTEGFTALDWLAIVGMVAMIYAAAVGV